MLCYSSLWFLQPISCVVEEVHTPLYSRTLMRIKIKQQKIGVVELITHDEPKRSYWIWCMVLCIWDRGVVPVFGGARGVHSSWRYFISPILLWCLNVVVFCLIPSLHHTTRAAHMMCVTDRFESSYLPLSHFCSDADHQVCINVDGSLSLHWRSFFVHPQRGPRLYSL